MKEDQLLSDLFRAYYDARRNKRNTLNQLRFEMELEQNLVELAQEIRSESYRVSPSVCFIVNKPVRREIFAADFRDRVVHHLLVNYTGEIFERNFITDCYSCRKGYGTSFGVRRLDHHIRSCTDNYRHKAYVLKMDIQGYFMSIDRELLYHKTVTMLEKGLKRKNKQGLKWESVLNVERVMFLLKEIIFNDPTENCRVKGNCEDWNGMPRSKSLFYARQGCGLPIGRRQD